MKPWSPSLPLLVVNPRRSLCFPTQLQENRGTVLLCSTEQTEELLGGWGLDPAVKRGQVGQRQRRKLKAQPD